MSFIKKEAGDGLAKSDLMTIIAIAFIGSSLWFYTNYTKQQSFDKFDLAKRVSEKGTPEEAYAVWTELQTVEFKNDSLDEILYTNLSELEEMKMNNQEGYRTIRDWIRDGKIHQVKIQKKLHTIQEPHFLKPNQVKNIKAWRLKFGKYRGLVADSLTPPIDTTLAMAKIGSDLSKVVRDSLPTKEDSTQAK